MQYPRNLCKTKSTTYWTPIKVSRNRIGPDSSNVDILLDDCLSLDYQAVDGVPGFEVVTKDSSFWAPISHCTRARLKLMDT